MKKQIKQSVNITDNEKYVDFETRKRPAGWKCGATIAPPIHKVALRHRAERLKKEEENHG